MAMTIGIGGTIMPPIEGVVRAALRAERAGYSAMWWPDHLMGWHPESIWTPDISPIAGPVYANPHIYIDPIAAIAAVGVQTSRIRLGTAVTEPIRRHPAMLANEFLTLDHVTKGRVILGIGAGEAENITPYGMDYSRPVSRFEEALTIIRLLWAHPGEPVDFDGSFWTLRKAVSGMSPFTSGRFPPIWTGAHGPKMLEITGRLADGWIPVIMPPGEYGHRLDLIRKAARDAGRDTDAFEAGIFAYTVVANDHDRAHELLEHRIVKGLAGLALPSEIYEARGYEHPLGKGAYGLRDYIPTHLGREEALAAIDKIPFDVTHDAFAHGTPDELIAIVRDFEAAGCQHFMFLNATYLGDASLVRESFYNLDTIVDAFASS